MLPTPILFIFFFFNDTATTEIYTLSLHDALPISIPGYTPAPSARSAAAPEPPVPTDRYRRSAEQHGGWAAASDRKSTRLNSSHSQNLVCRLLLEKKKKKTSKQELNYVS